MSGLEPIEQGGERWERLVAAIRDTLKVHGTQQQQSRSAGTTSSDSDSGEIVGSGGVTVSSETCPVCGGEL